MCDINTQGQGMFFLGEQEAGFYKPFIGVKAQILLALHSQSIFLLGFVPNEEEKDTAAVNCRE